MKVVYDIEGLDCAHCAKGIENYLNNVDGIKEVNINFIAKKMSIEYQDEVFSESKLLEIILKSTDDPIQIKEHQDKKTLKVKILDKDIYILLIRIAISIVLLITAAFVLEPFSKQMLDGFWWAMLSTYLVAYFVISYDYLWKFIKSFRHPSKMFNEVVLMEVASIGAFLIQSYPEAVLVMILAQVGEIFEHISLNKSKNSIIDTIDMRPKTANKVVGEQIVNISAMDLKVGDEIVLKTGEIVPVDGKVVSGNGLLDTSSVTGEFKPVALKSGDEVLSGTLISDGIINLKVNKAYHDSTTSKILKMVMDSSEHKSKAEHFISKFAMFYTPIVFALSVIIGLIVPLIALPINYGGYSWDNWYSFVYTALTFLVISCPCAIVISVPLSYFVGVALASKKGIMIKGSNYLDRLNELKLVVSDKTGTLTSGKFSLKEKKIESEFVDVFDEYVKALESFSTHPIAKAICHDLDVEANLSLMKNFHDLPGYGVEGEYNFKYLSFGNIALMNKNRIKVKEVIKDALYLAVDGKYAGYIIVDDTIKENSKKMVAYLSKKGIDTLVLTGGNLDSTKEVCETLGVTRYHANLLPQDKIAYLKQELQNKKPHSAVAYIGDGINDAPSIILSDVGFAMGGLGSDAAIENADIVLMNDDPIKVVEAIKIAKLTRQRAIFNIVFAFVVKITVMILSLLSLIDMWVAVLSDTGLSVLLIIVSILLIKSKIKVD